MKRNAFVLLACAAACLAPVGSRHDAAAGFSAAGRNNLLADAIDETQHVSELIRKGDSQLWAEFVLKPVNRVNVFTSVTKRAVLYQSSRFQDHAVLIVYRLNKNRRYEVRMVQLEDHPDKFFDDGGSYDR